MIRAADGAPKHILVTATLGAAARRRSGRARRRPVAPEPEPAPVTTSRATVIDAQPSSAEESTRWLADAGVETAAAALVEVGRAVRAHRIASGDAATREPGLAQALAIRVGYGAGEEVADGRWTAAQELSAPHGRRRRATVLHPQERLAALLGGRARALACEELTLRARADLDHGDLRAAALQLRIALDAALAELPADAPELAERIEELRDRRPAADAIADAALGGVVPSDAATTLAATLGRLEAALRARIAAER